MALAHLFRSERLSLYGLQTLVWTKTVEWSQLFPALWSSTEFDQRVMQDNLPLPCCILWLQGRLGCPSVLLHLPLFPGFYSTTAPLPFSQVSAVCCQLSSAPEQVEQNPDVIQRNKVSGQIASSLAKNIDVEDNMFLPGNTSLLSRLCENACKHTGLHRAFLEGNDTRKCHYLECSQFFP